MKSSFIVRCWKYYWIILLCFLKSMLSDLRSYLKFYFSLNKRQSGKQSNLQWSNIASWLCLGTECDYWLGRGTGSFWMLKYHGVISGYLDVCIYKHPSHHTWIPCLCLNTSELWGKDHVRDLRELHLHPKVSFHDAGLSWDSGKARTVLSSLESDRMKGDGGNKGSLPASSWTCSQ